MTTATFTSQPGSLRHYLNDVSIAARALAEALFAAQGRPFLSHEVRSAKSLSARDKRNGRRHVFALAIEHESMSPNLSAELRSIAARD